ncbi:otopetrin-2-like isoform X2 [Cimex lectularius]|uniref:Otopetrin n=1 Tax=Cimex lectularius TaxID=79782 RepID=A0A8I6S327_CIMLE|nr:otopetrin-2-like isoform X2 [Cimex lectularius]
MHKNKKMASKQGKSAATLQDSSPDLSLKLRRGSSDSRDSFYMDFAQGIDSDIEEVAATTSGFIHQDITDDASTPTAATVKEDGLCWTQVGICEPVLLPSPASPNAVIVSPETLSHHSSPVRQPRSTSRATTSSVKPHPLSASFSGLPHPGSQTMLPAVLYHPNISMMKRPSRIDQLQITWRKMGAQALATTLSALYGKLLVVMGIAFPMAEVISTHIPPSFYEGFYLYLYFGSMAFLFYMYAMLLKDDPSNKTPPPPETERPQRDTMSSSSGECESGSASGRDTNPSYTEREPSRPAKPQVPFQHYGSFYLRMGAVAFGIGSMIYSGLEFGQYFELERNTKCHNVLLALTPATRMAFTFIQMYFIFLNDEQQMRVTRHKVLARFGLMHMIGTNLSVWLNVLVQETKHEILTFYNPENNTIEVHAKANTHSMYSKLTMQHQSHHRVTRGLMGPHHIYECRRTNIMGSLVQDASPFLFPCTIEYSLICAAILYVMWKNISRITPPVQSSPEKMDKVPPFHYKRSPHHYSVDCAQAHKGLFVGILVLVLTIISLILFFVLISRPELVSFAVMELTVCELSLYAMATFATMIGMIQVRQLKYDGTRNLELDNILLIGAQTGMFIYSTFTIIGGHFTLEKNTILVLVTALASLLQTLCQTMFVLDASRRSCVTPEQIRKKPGREIVTFLLVTNLAMWAINTLEKSRAESHPIQLHFYGLWAWTIITHVSMPLAIFYRFHSTVCLCEIWKRAYKMKPAYM